MKLKNINNLTEKREAKIDRYIFFLLLLHETMNDESNERWGSASINEKFMKWAHEKRSHSTFRWNELQKKCLSEWENWWWWDEGEGRMERVENSGWWREIWAFSFSMFYVAACPIIMDDDVTNGRPVVGRMDSLETCATLNKHFFRFSRYLNIFIIDNRNLSVFSGKIGLARPLLLDFSLRVWTLTAEKHYIMSQSFSSRRVYKCLNLWMSMSTERRKNKNVFRVFPSLALNTKCH